MRFALPIAAAFAAATVSAKPIGKRGYNYDDCLILNYALTLEHLEDKFYREGLAKFSKADFAAAGFDDKFYANLKIISSDETTHVTFLTTAITAAGCPYTVPELTYKFPYTDAKSFVALASVLEGVGVSAYLGAAASIVNKDYLTAAGSILTVEARHSSYIRGSQDQSPFPEPFDTPLSLNSVFSLAAPFITGGDAKISPPLKAFPPLTLQCSQYYYEAGRSSVTFKGASKAYPSTTPLYAVFWCGLAPTFIPVRTTGDDYKIGSSDVSIPDACTGQIYVALTKSNDAKTGGSDDNIVAGPAILEVYPKGGAPAGKLTC